MSNCETYDQLLLDRLYEELPPAEQAAYDQHVESCAACQAELQQLMGVREMFRALPEEEPPPAISAFIMKEAAARAPRRARGGLWARLSMWLQPVLAHPGLAAAASFLVVAGVAGVFALNGRGKVAEPTLASSAAQEGAIARDVSGAAIPAPGADLEEGAAAGDMAANLAAPEPRAEGVPAEVPRPTVYDVDMAQETPQNERRAAERAVEGKGDARDQALGAALEPSQGGFASGRGGSVAAPGALAKPMEPKRRAGAPKAALADKDAIALDDVPASPPAPMAQTAQQWAQPPADAEEQAARDEDAFASAPAADGIYEAEGKVSEAAVPAKRERTSSSSSSLDTQRLALFAAAEAGQCTEAARLANAIYDRDPAYFRSRVAGAKDLASCREVIAKATSRRAPAKSKAASKPKAGSADTGATTKD